MAWRCNDHHGRVWFVTIWDRMDSSDQRNTPGSIISSQFPVKPRCNFQDSFSVGFRACIIRGASVIYGMVRTGVSSIIICSSFLTLCSTCGVFADAGGWRITLIFALSSLMSRLPLLVALVIAVDLTNSLVSAQKCWCRVMFGIWQGWGKSSVDS